jgi:hypothetical protein
MIRYSTCHSERGDEVSDEESYALAKLARFLDPNSA